MTATNETVYMSTMLAGLENIIVDEIRSKISDVQIVEKQRGKVFFRSRQPLQNIMSLRSIDNLFIFISKFSVGPHKIHLKELEEKMRVIDVSKAVDLSKVSNRNVSFTINSSRSGKQTFSRFDLSEAASRGLLRQFPEWKIGTPEDHLLEFRLDLIDEQAIFCYRLTNSTFRFRGKQRLFSKAALRPSIAHALIWHSQPQKDECFLDPFCGSGTILAERAFYPFGQLLGGDISEEVAEIAKNNVPNLDNLVISQWDARELPLDAGSVDVVVSNLPFGEQILNPNEIYDLYLKFMKQLKRILKPGGHAILMTDKVHELQRVADKFNLEYYIDFELSLKGLHPRVFKINL